MADAHGSGPCVREDVGVQVPPRPLLRAQRGPVNVEADDLRDAVQVDVVAEQGGGT